MARRHDDQPRLPEFAKAEKAAEGPVECLGRKFPSDQARREHYLQRLREALEELHERLGGAKFTTLEDALARFQAIRKWPMGEEAALRALTGRLPEAHRREPRKDLLQLWKDEVGFPHGEIVDILRLSDPPYYTACPNPFLGEFVRHVGKPYDPKTDKYRREPFAVDVSEGKTHPLYKAHSYHTKVPHLAIVPSILHYTEPGDVVLDGFAGSGMAGVAAQWCGAPPADYRATLEERWKREGHGKPKWGPRYCILNDLAPAATFMAANYNLPFPVEEFSREGTRILQEVEAELGWMYETNHKDGKVGRIEYTVWSELFSCPECSGEVVFVDEALNKRSGKVRDTFPCPHCRADLTKDNLQRCFETLADPVSKSPWKRIKLRPAIICYTIGGKSLEKQPDGADLKVLATIQSLRWPAEVPSNRFPIEQMYHGTRIEPKGFTRVHHFFLARAAHALAALWRKAEAHAEPRLRNMLLFFVEQAFWTMSVCNSYRPTGFSQVSQYMKGIYYVPSQHSEVTPWYVLDGKLGRLGKAFGEGIRIPPLLSMGTGTAARLNATDGIVDYIFTDPPFGENIYYADLNFLVESWHGVLTNAVPEAIVDQAKKKGLHEYQLLMQACFDEYYRVLKPGRWMTLVFHNSHNVVWNAIQEAMLQAGFIVADVRTLDKQQGSYRQVTSTAAKQDLVISAYKPNGGLEERFRLEAGSVEGVWDFVRSHLRQLPVFVEKIGKAEVIAERQDYYLYDRMVAYHVRHGVLVPLSAGEFCAGLGQKFVHRDGMYFLPEQAAEYDRKRLKVAQLEDLPLFVLDEASAVQWLRYQLKNKPQTFQELHPQFIQEIGGWRKHEQLPELKTMLAENFLVYSGREALPKQIVAWLKCSETHRAKIEALEKGQKGGGALETGDLVLLRAAKDRWYVPDPNQAQDLEKLRERALLREFWEYLPAGYKPKPVQDAGLQGVALPGMEDALKAPPAPRDKRLKVIRTEAVRAGFKFCYQNRDYQTIIAIARRIPEEVLQEDPKLLMWYDHALTRTGEET